jgi:glycerol-3-phosphate cytidylyltransferase
MAKVIVGYTAGAFDLFHIGHLNILLKAKDHCDKLIVGISTNEVILASKGKLPIIPFEERMQIVNHIDIVDEVRPQDDLDKLLAWEKYHYDLLFSGDDWKENERWKKYEQKLAEVGVKIIYFPYTQTTSSSKIREILSKF